MTPIPGNEGRITDERAGSEDSKHTSVGVFMAVDSNLGAVVGEREGAVASIPGGYDRVRPDRLAPRLS